MPGLGFQIAVCLECSGKCVRTDAYCWPAQVPKEWMKYILPKGFIAVDGCSLTVRTQLCTIMILCVERIQLGRQLPGT